METTITQSILSVNDIQSQIESSNKNVQDSINEKMNQLLTVQAKKEEKLSFFQNNLPSLIECLEKQGLAISKVGYHKSGMNSDKWEEGDMMIMSLQLIPTSGKFKFIKFNDYLSSGRGRNHDRLVEKAHKLEDSIKQSTSFTSCNVNKFSLEIRDEKDSKSILLVITIK